MRALSRLHIRLSIGKPGLTDITAEVIRLAERFIPGVPHFLAINGDTMTFRVRHDVIRVCQTDLLVCRLARIRGIRYVSAEQENTLNGVVYHAGLRGRAWERQSGTGGKNNHGIGDRYLR